MRRSAPNWSRLEPLIAPLLLGVLALVVWFGPVTPDFAFVGLLGSADGPIDLDVGLYFSYADRMADGDLPYRDFLFEYPPLSLPLIVAPYTGSEGDLLVYRDALEALNGLLLTAAAVATLLAARAAACDRPTQWAAGGLVALGPLLLGHGFAEDRLDLLPVFFVALAALAAARRREAVAGALAGLGAAAKLWPGLMLVPLAALAYRSGGRSATKRVLAAFALAIAIPFALAIAVSPSGVLDFVRFHSDRPLQIEAVGANGLLMLDQLGVGGPYESVASFESRSLNLVGGPTEAVAAIGTLLGLALAASLLWLGVRRVLEAPTDQDAFATAMLATFAATVAMIAFGKVLSPQFLLWLLPLPLLVGGTLRWLAGGLVAAVLLLTNLAFEHHDAYALDFDFWPTAAYMLRSLMLLALLAVLTGALAGRSSQAEESRR